MYGYALNRYGREAVLNHVGVEPTGEAFNSDVVRSNRIRTPDERGVLDREGHKVAVLEAQGSLFFGSTEQLLRRITQLAAPSSARSILRCSESPSPRPMERSTALHANDAAASSC
jgi:MFS superfamily sulfate permease-like transporter